MYLSYFDEAGDDGYPGSSPIFVLTAIYLHHQNWKDTFNAFYSFRQFIKQNYNFPIKTEFHTRHFILNKDPYRNLGLSDGEKVALIDNFCSFLSSLSLKTVNVAINKKAVPSSPYDVLDNAMTYMIQRLENDLNRNDPSGKFLIITDEGRVGKMRKTSRRVQRFNYIPSIVRPGTSYRQEIKLLIEDPLPKSSDQSYFIQASDLISLVVYYYVLLEKGIGGLPSRMPPQVTHSKIKTWMTVLMPILNTEASRTDPFGVVIYPR